ncbi:metallophosphoesterase [Streptomyces sp. NPDC094448]|uniref:metallophosphoesterase n=1 Tax=Streptomyces sp. NPDC094448 TaxID=3366063 RepID=UPI0037FED301
MTQGAGQGPVVRTATLRDFRVPPYAQMPVQSEPAQDDERPENIPAPRAPEAAAPPPAGPGSEPHQAVREYPAAAVPQHEQGQQPAHRTDIPGYEQEPAPYPGPQQDHRVHPAAEPPSAHRPHPEPYADPAPAGHPGGDRPYPAQTHPGDALTGQAHAAEVHPGNAVPEDELPEGYTPTERDLPVIGRAEPDPGTLPLTGTAEAPVPTERGPLYVVGDVHGYLDQLVAALTAQGLIDAEGNWAAGNARLWFLGDFTDRGPDGIGVIDLVMRLSAEAAAAGGYCKALMGNHELLLLGAKRFVDTPVNSGAGTATFQAAWLLNGGQKSDMDRLQDVHVQWMARLDAVAVEDDHLLLHSDTTAYLDYGDTVEDVNEAVQDVLTRNDPDECWDLFRKMTKRFSFRDEEAGPPAVRELLGAYGGSRVVHGHSPIPYLLGEVGTEDGEDGERPVVEGPHVYADGLAIAMDGGVTMAGKLLVVQLPVAG